MDILKIEKINIPIANIEISNPLNGRNVKNAALIPRIEINPIPQATQPGANIPRKIPVVPKKPIFPEAFLIMIVLYVIKLNKRPRRMLMVIKLTKELNRTVPLNPKKRLETNLIVSKKPFLLKK